MNLRLREGFGELKMLVKVFLPVTLFFVIVLLYQIFPGSVVLYWTWLALWLVILPVVLFYFLFIYPRRRGADKKEKE